MASIALKWGNLKGWSDLTKDHPAREAADRFLETTNGNAMQRLNDEQKALLCELIDLIDGEIENDWTGVKMTKDEAKAYVLEYGKNTR